MSLNNSLLSHLKHYAQKYPQESDTVEQFLALLGNEPRCFYRDCFPAHITGSAWIVDPAGHEVLLTHHRKLDRWFQPGGHSDGDSDTARVAEREAVEETGLDVQLVQTVPHDLDIHTIPARNDEPQHQHYDVRYLFRSNSREFSVSEESHALAWVPFDELSEYSSDVSLHRMLRKWRSTS